MSVDSSALSALPLFRDVSAEAVRALASRAVEAHFDTDAVLFRAGSVARGWYVVLEGCVRVTNGAEPRQYVLHTERAGGTLAEVPMFGGVPHPATGVAAEPTRCAIFDRRSLEAAMAECPEIGFLINRRLALRVKRLVERLDERSRSVRSRLAEFLLERFASSSNGERISLGLTQQQLAEELGTVREVVAREIKLLIKEHIIESLGGGRYRVLRADVLRSRYADGA
ncbi:MAG TPA: Crp/Fnr family transcriptional regulator [Gemmatimonadaceae bacterium]|jgi:CRP/FNR family transcriptional regulator